MAIERPQSKDPSTRVGEGLSELLSNIQDSIKGENPVGFGQEVLSPQEYKKRLLAMSPGERMKEMETRGIDAVTDALREI